MKALSDKLFYFVKILTLIVITVMTVSAFLQVIFRYVFAYPLIWTEEVARFMFVWLTFLGSAAAIRTKNHIAMDLLVNFFPQKMQKFVNLLALAIFFGFCLLLIKQGIFLTTMNMEQTSDALGIPMGYPYLAIPVGGALMAFFILEDMLNLIRKEAN
ncbi:MAG: TRAP transporter small permease [Bacillota bacterium]